MPNNTYSNSSPQTIIEKCNRFGDIIHEKLSEPGYKYDGPMKNIAQMIMDEARSYFSDKEMDALESPKFDQKLLDTAQELNRLSQLLMPPGMWSLEEENLSQGLWSSLLGATIASSDFEKNLMTEWTGDLDPEVIECWTKDSYSPDNIRRDIRIQLHESFSSPEKKSVVEANIVESGTKLAAYMLKQWNPEQVNEFYQGSGSPTPPTYEDGIKAARSFIRYKQKYEENLEFKASL